MPRIHNNRIRALMLPLFAVACAPTAIARIDGASGAGDPSNDATSLQQYGVGGPSHGSGGSIPPGVAAPMLGNRPSPVPTNPMPHIPTGPNGGTFGNGAGEGPMHAPTGATPTVTPVPLPSPFGLGVTGLLAATAIRRRRAR